MSLTFDGKQAGEQLLKALLQSGGAGIKAVLNSTAYEPRKIAKLIRDENAQAIIWHPTEALPVCFALARDNRQTEDAKRTVSRLVNLFL